MADARNIVMQEYARARSGWMEDARVGSTARETQELALSGWMLPEEERGRCAAAGCNAQSSFWKRAVRPVFEGQWACSKECTRALVAAEIQRQMRLLAGATATEHRHRIPLGLVLLNRGLITQTQLRMALEAQRAAGCERIGYWLEQVCGISEERITMALASQWNRPVLSAEGFAAQRMALVMPEPLRKQLRALPLRVAAGRMLYLGFEQEIHAAGVRAVERMCGLRVESGVVAGEAAKQVDAALSAAGSVACEEERCADAGELCQQIVGLLRKMQPVASRLVAIDGAWWLRMWLERGAVGPYGTLPLTGEDVVDHLFRM